MYTTATQRAAFTLALVVVTVYCKRRLVHTCVTHEFQRGRYWGSHVHWHVIARAITTLISGVACVEDLHYKGNLRDVTFVVLNKIINRN